MGTPRGGRKKQPEARLSPRRRSVSALHPDRGTAGPPDPRAGGRTRPSPTRSRDGRPIPLPVRAGGASDPTPGLTHATVPAILPPSGHARPYT